MAVYKTEHDGAVYAWIEKGARACLTVDETRMLWWGDPCDPVSLREIRGVPLEVLLTFSLLREVDKA